MTDEREAFQPMMPEEMWETIQSFFTAMAKSIQEGTTGGLGVSAGLFLNELLSREKENTAEAKPLIIPYLAYCFGIDEDVAREWYEGLDLPWPLSWIMLAVTLLTTLGTRAMRSSDVFLEKDIQRLLSQSGHTLPDPGSLIRSAFIDSGRTQGVRDKLKLYGYSDENIDNLFIASYQLYDLETIRTAWLRKIIDDKTLYERMREHGFTDTRINEIVQTWPILPGPQDLFWMVGKEAFEPETYVKLGLDEEFPEEQLEWLKQQGISEGWAHKYWIAHWDQPSIQQGYEMLHRGVIGMEELDILFKTVEIPPYWREKLTAIAYQPYTRVDVRRMHNLGIIDDAGLIKAYKDLGYDDEHALNMAEFTVKYNEDTDKQTTKGEILKAYRKKAVSYEDAKDLLRSIDITEAYAEFLLAFQDYLEQEEIEEMRLKNIRDMFEGNLLEESEVHSMLGKMNLPAARVEVLIEKWKINKLENRKVPSKTDMLKFLKLGVINLDQYKQEMYRLGYSWLYVEWYSKQAEIEVGLRKEKSTT